MRASLFLLVSLLGTAAAVPQDDPSPLTFEARIRPILKTHCFQCHGEQPDGKPKAKLDIRLKRFLLKGGRSGPAVVMGSREKSLSTAGLTSPRSLSASIVDRS